jgi:serralysin
MATYDPALGLWILDPTESNFAAPVGNSNDRIEGNDLNNQLIGNAGNNGIYGGSGDDTLIGGLGNDFYYIHSLGDVIVEASNEGNDSVSVSLSINYILIAITSKETLKI